MKKHLPTIILILVFLTGLSLLLYPTISNWWNSFHSSRAIADYEHTVSAMDADFRKQMWKDAKSYNKQLKKRTENPYVLSAQEMEKYNAVLDVNGDGMMGYLEIPVIDVKLPVYHGTEDAVLSAGVGHIAGSSLPVGGKGTHCVLSGHRGLPSATLLSDLDELREGDVFMLYTLDRTLTYEVDQIRIVEPEQVETLAMEKGKDYCTLVTCTPYGVNTHRLLVRGHRIENLQEDRFVAADASQLDKIIVASVIAAIIFIILLIFLLIKTRKRRSTPKKERDDFHEIL